MTEGTAERERTRPRWPAWLPWGLFGLAVALHVTDVVLGLRAGLGWRSAAWFPAMAGFAGVGALIAGRTGNRFGWLFLAFGLSLLLGVVLSDYAARPGVAALPGAALVGWTFTIVIESSFPLFALALLVFPSGRLPSRLWRPVAVAVMSAGVLTMALVAVSNLNFSNNFRNLTDPVTLLRAAPLRGIFNFLGAVPILALAAWTVSLVVRLVRSRGEERLQLKWFAYASVVAAIAIAIATSTMAQPSSVFEIFAPLIPIGAGVAILKYRLYDIDIVINRTVVYAALAAFITGIYVAIVVGIGSLVGRTDKPNVALSILATAIVAIAFQPVRERVQRFANRLVYGKRATPYEALSRFSDSVGTAVASEEMLPRVARVLAEATGATSTRVWVRSGDALVMEATFPETGIDGAEAPVRVPLVADALPPLPMATKAFEVRHQGELLGALALTKRPGEGLTPTEDQLAARLASQAGLVLRNVGLTERLKERMAELRASRQRIVVAADEERRLLERDVHDGAQQHLVALSVKVRLAEDLIGRDPSRARSLVEQLQGDAGEALENLRDLARGVYPPLLADRGLVAALEAQARKLSFPVAVASDGVGRYVQGVEAAVYFCVLEALQNVAKYAGAASAVVRLGERDGRLEFTVADEGRGFDTTSTGYGTGLQGMADRLAALDGELVVRSTPGRGTTVTGRVPAGQLEPAR